MRDPLDISNAIKRKCEGFVSLILDLRSHRKDYSLEDFWIMYWIRRDI